MDAMFMLMRYLTGVRLYTVFPVKFHFLGFVPLTTEKWGYKEKNRGTKQN